MLIGLGFGTPRPEKQCHDCLFDLGSLHSEHGLHCSFAQSTDVTTTSHLLAKFTASGGKKKEKSRKISLLNSSVSVKNY